jgi:sugar lactone lactonase YvrE
MKTLMTGIAMGESPRWHDGRLWFSDWKAGEVIALDLDGTHEVIATVDSFPTSASSFPAARSRPGSSCVSRRTARSAAWTAT